MIIYNTTFHAHNSIADNFIGWLKKEYVPAAMADGRLTEPRLSLVLNAEENDGKNYSLQFRAADIDTLSDWYATIGNGLVATLNERFGDCVAGFSTLLEEVEL